MGTFTQVKAGDQRDTGRMSTTRAPASRTTTAFILQAAISFAVSLIAVCYAIAHLPGNAWIRGFLLLGTLYIVTSTFTLSKCIRDQAEASAVVSRVDQARLEKILAEYDPFKQSLPR